MAKNPTKDELRTEIQNILKDANLEETASKKVRQQLEKNLNCDLSNRKKEVDELVMDYVNSQASADEEEEDDGEDDDYAGNGKGDDDDEDENDDDEDDEDYSEEEKPKGRKSAGSKRSTPAKRGPAKKKKRTSNSDDDSDDDDDQGSDDDYNPRGGSAKGSKKKKNDSDSDSDGDWKQSKPAAKGKKKGDGDGAKRSTGYTRAYTLSADLAALCGAESLPRHEVVKIIWAKIKERNLYDPKNRQFAICDDELRKVIGVKRFRTFGMLKYLKQHFKE